MASILVVLSDPNTFSCISIYFSVCTDQIIMETNKDLQMTDLQDKYNRLSIEETTEMTEMSEEGAVSAEEVRILLFSIPFFLVKKGHFCLLLLTESISFLLYSFIS